jgi:SAM-dependent methyltransferase
MGEHYGSDYDRAVAEARQAPDHWLPRVKEISRLKSGGALLDIGCGSGGFLGAIKGPSWRLSGIEISEGAAKVARSRCDADVFVGDALDAPFAPASFDMITCFNVFEHFYEPKEVLERVAEWLKPGGIFFTMMPNSNSAATRIFRSYWYALELPRHLFHFSPVSLRKLAKSCRLEEVAITTHRELYFEASVRYMVDDLLRKIGIARRPLAAAKEPSLPFKVIRKIFRMTVLPVFTAAASLAGDGETITAVFTKAPQR